MSGYFEKEDRTLDGGKVARWIIGSVVAFIVGCFLIFGGIGVFARYQDRVSRDQARSQALKDANNKVRVSSIEIRNQKQRVKITEQQADIRYRKAVGVRAAQDEIAKTLTPLYVQFEMTDAIKQIAKSGRNSSVIYLPSGANGIPLVATTDPNKVTAP